MKGDVYAHREVPACGVLRGAPLKASPTGHPARPPPPRAPSPQQGSPRPTRLTPASPRPAGRSPGRVQSCKRHPPQARGATQAALGPESEHLGQVDHILAPQLHGSPPTAAPLAEGFPPGQISSPASWPRGPPVPAPVTSALGSGVQPHAPLHPLTPGPPGHRAPHSPGLTSLQTPGPRS